MIRYLARRLIQIPVIILLVLTFIFASMYLSGDPSTLFLTQDSGPEDVARVRKRLGLDDPLPVQYARFITNGIRGNFENSLRYHQPAIDLLLSRFPATLQLAGVSILFSLLLGIPVGTISALRKGSWLDRVLMAVILLGQGVPVFWTGIMLIIIFSVRLHWFPSSGAGSWEHFVLPSVTLGAFFAARIARFTRTALIDVLPQNYVRTAHAKGLPRFLVLWRHAGKNAAIPVVTITGLTLPSLISGAVLTEAVFSWPGIGSFIVTAVYNRDYPVVQAGAFVIALFVGFLNIVVDIIYTVLDPRIKLE
jgi:peptide/nickel transport system permease protein